MKTFFILCTLILPIVAAASDDPNVDIAREYLSEHKYAQAIKTCKEVLAESPGEKGCTEVTQKANAALNQAKINANKARAQAAAKREAAESKAAAEERAASIQAEAERKAVEARLNSPACLVAKLVDHYCGNLQSIKSLQLQVDHEKAVGQQSGFVNATLLRNSTSSILILSNEAEANKAEVEKLSPGRHLSEQTCEITKLPSGYYAIPDKKQVEFDAAVKQACGGH